jgi:hypothetical protein
VFKQLKKEHYKEIKAYQAQAKLKKIELIKRAKKLADSTNYVDTAREFRDLMGEWRLSGRAPRRDDSALWQEFKEIQDKFFENMRRADNVASEEQEINLTKKKELLQKAHDLIYPIENVKKARAAFRTIQDEWNSIGQVPLRDMKSINGELKDIESDIHSKENEEWNKSNPEKQARVQETTSQLDNKIKKLEEKLKRAQESGNKKEIKMLEETIRVRKAWLDQISDIKL